MSARAMYLSLTGIILVLALSITFCSLARAHSWYDSECCSDTDCRPVPDEDVAERKDGVFVKGWGLLLPSDKRLRWSKDQQSHICVGSLTLRCVYRKPNSM
jgi:hypothetical protein